MNFLNIDYKHKLRGKIINNLKIEYRKILKKCNFKFYKYSINCYYGDILVITIHGYWKRNFFTVRGLLLTINNNKKYIRYKK